MHSIRPDRPVPPLIIELLHHVDTCARSFGLPYFVAGAFARDLLLMHVHGFDLPRPTRDVDIAVAVRDWAGFEQVKTELVRTGEFSTVEGMAHRLRFRAQGQRTGTPLDVVPFGGVEEDDRTLRWPPGGDIVMNVAGFEEALGTAEEVQLTSRLSVRVASLPGQVLLKLVAWLDRRHETPRDAQDLLALFRRYGDAGNFERLYEEKPTLLEEVGFDMERAGATLLGEDVRAMTKPRSLELLYSSFASPNIRENLLTHVSSAALPGSEDAVDRARTLIDAFFSGFGKSS